VTPDFTRSGKWHINPDNPLTEKPEGLSDDTLVAANFIHGDWLIAPAKEMAWHNVTAFAVLEGGSDE